MSLTMLPFLLIPVVIFCVVAFFERTHIKSFANFFQHGDKISRFQFFATLTSSTAGLASVLLLIAVYGYFYGLGVCLWIVVFWWLTQWASKQTILRVEKLHPGFWEKRGTLHEFLGLSFSSVSARASAAIVSILYYTLLLAAEVLLSYRLVFAALEGGDGTITAFPLSGFPVTIHTLLLGAVLLYTALAGFRAVIRTDSIQFAVVGLMLAAVLCVLGIRLPEILQSHEEIFGSTVLQSVLNPVARDPLSFIFFFVFMNLIFWMAWWPGAMDQWHRSAATTSVDIPTDKTLGTSGYGARAYILVLAMSFVLIGAATRVFVVPGAEIADPLPVFLRAVMPGGALAFQDAVLATLFSGVFLMGLLAVVLSTIDTYLVVITQSFMLDVFIARKTGKTLFEADKTPALVDRYLPRARLFVILWFPVVLVAVWLVSHVSLDAFNIVYMAFAFQMALIAVLLVALFGKGKGRGRSAVTSFVVGAIWCAVTFPILIHKVDEAVLAGDLDTMYFFLDLMFLNTVLVTLVAGVGYVIGLICFPRKTAIKD